MKRKEPGTVLTKETIDYGEFIGSYCKLMSAKTVVEVGVQLGDTTIELCKAVKITNGKVYGYDIFEPMPPGYPKLKPGQSKEEVEERLESLGFKDYFKITKTNTFHDEFDQKLKEDLGKNRIDLAFIDGCHSYEGVLNDFKKIYSHLSYDGSIVFHDTFSHTGPRKFVLDLYGKLNDGTFDIINIPFGTKVKGKSHHREAARVGLTILVKRSYPLSYGISSDQKHDKGSSKRLGKKYIYKEETKWFKDELSKKNPKSKYRKDKE